MIGRKLVLTVLLLAPSLLSVSALPPPDVHVNPPIEPVPATLAPSTVPRQLLGRGGGDSHLEHSHPKSRFRLRSLFPRMSSPSPSPSVPSYSASFEEQSCPPGIYDLDDVCAPFPAGFAAALLSERDIPPHDAPIVEPEVTYHAADIDTGDFCEGVLVENKCYIQDE